MEGRQEGKGSLKPSSGAGAGGGGSGGGNSIAGQSGQGRGSTTAAAAGGSGAMGVAGKQTGGPGSATKAKPLVKPADAGDAGAKQPAEGKGGVAGERRYRCRPRQQVASAYFRCGVSYPVHTSDD
jgi:hypothetical protein